MSTTTSITLTRTVACLSFRARPSGHGPRLGSIVHHTDDEREFAYDRDAHAGRLSRALDAAPSRGWAVVDMKRDWNRVFR